MEMTSIRKALSSLREEAGISQAELAKRLPFTASRISRLESGEIAMTEEDAQEIAKAIGTPKANDFNDYLSQDWRILGSPGFNHINRETLWEAEQALQRLEDLESDPELKNVFLQQVKSCNAALEQSAQFLMSTQHQIAFFGSPGVGKTTSICALSDLEKSAGKDLKHQMVLPTGSGRTTICEVHVRNGSDYSIIVDPCSVEDIRQYVADFSEQIIRSDRASGTGENAEGAGVSAEVERALRNMSGLTKRTLRNEDGKIIKREDPALNLVAQYNTKEDLQVHIMSKLDLPRRNQTSISMPRESTISGLDWVAHNFADINDGKNVEFSLPRRIEVTIPSPILNSEAFDIRLIDTRGIDEPSAPRRDVQAYLDDERTIAVFCSSFKDAPDAAMLALLERSAEGGLRESVLRKGMLLVLPLDGEESDVRDNISGDAEEGREIRREQVMTTLRHVRTGNLQVEFLNVKSSADRNIIRNALLEIIARIRERQIDQVKTLISTVNGLIENKANAEAKAVFDAAIRPLRLWFSNNQSVNQGGKTPSSALMEEMEDLRYAASLHASVNRYGNWYNFDYWHCLGFGARREVVTRISDQATVLKGLIETELSYPESEQVHGFLSHFQRQIEEGLNQFYKDIQTLGETYFLDQLKSDFAYWNQCTRRWGRGPGYKNDIKHWTDDWFSKPERLQRYDFLEQEIQRRWQDLLKKLDKQLASIQPEGEVNAP
ncbi:helix-turn-helix domain-containing protein [Desulfobacca acetoxidans]|uniref:Helix-turn-helix domain protein n=1 Tax=Desulfobacca acetoxidans (strain ATCC 700848 / DSM 11109 / ASRB2) TaxID=880072 RepID=F2NGN6_DESAR|nr:helix-turn-helix transcriptional regulator [Desulfobacca acetoxidans]AEB07943.1 helix-turn-helix domain protein [Desulfobacca acetoxidans DSM 11109]